MINYSSVSQTKGAKQGGTYCFDPIGFVESPFKDKYGIPRQSSLAVAAKGKIKFKNDPDLVTALRSIEQFSHLWIIFVFHEHGGKNWKPSIRPPRLGGRQKVGVLASRSPHRPNPIGMSAVRIESVNLDSGGGPEIIVAGLDLLDGTPVLDVKPYIPYADFVCDAGGGWANEPVKKYPVLLSVEVQKEIEIIDAKHSEFSSLMQQILEIDPRPAYQKRKYPIDEGGTQEHQYGIEIMGFEVKYRVEDFGIRVQRVYRLGANKNED